MATKKTKKSKKNNDISEMLNKKCGGKVQKLADGGETVLFDSTKLTPEQQIEYSKFTTDKDKIAYQNSINQSGESPQDSGSSTASASSLIGAILNVSEGAAGEQDENKVYDSDIQAMMGQSSSGSGIEDAIDMFNSDEEGSNLSAIMNIFAPGIGALSTNELRANEADRLEKETRLKSAYYQKRASESFENGGKVKKEDPVNNSTEDLVLEYIKKIEPSIAGSIPVENPAGEIIPPENYIKQPYGTNPDTGDLLTKIVPKEETQEATYKHKDWFPQTEINSNQILRLFYNNTEGYDPYDPDSLQKAISGGKQLLGPTKEGFTDDDVFRVRQDSSGKYVLERNTIDPRTEKTIPDNKAKGGEITGPGTGKSDSISANIPVGSYIVPADAPKAAVDRLKKYMNYDETTLNSENGQPVNVSDGEIYIPPQDVPKANSFLKQLGYNNGLDGMAPNAKTKLGDNPALAEGGLLEGNVGTIAGAGQILYGLLEAEGNEKPKSDIEQLIADLSREVRTRAAYGMNPYERTQAEQSIERNLNNEKAIIQNAGTGSLDVIMNNMAAATMRANNAKLSLETTSNKIKEDKERYSDQITMKGILAHEKSFERDYNEYLGQEENAANLISSGIGNIIGQNQFNKSSEIFKEEETKSNNIIKDFVESITNSKDQLKDEDKDGIVNQNTNFSFNRFNKNKGV